MKLQTYLAHTGLTIAAFAARLGVKESTVLRWAKGTNRPRAHHVAAVVRETGGLVAVADLRPDLVDVLDAAPATPSGGTLGGASGSVPGLAPANDDGGLERFQMAVCRAIGSVLAEAKPATRRTPFRRRLDAYRDRTSIPWPRRSGVGAPE
jgi:hypothetical protein